LRRTEAGSDDDAAAVVAESTTSNADADAAVELLHYHHRHRLLLFGALSHALSLLDAMRVRARPLEGERPGLEGRKEEQKKEKE
jgi:hypothetical protein